MKIDLYIDIFHGTKPEYLMATQTPGIKSDGAKRYRILVNIPDHAFTGIIDGDAPVEELNEVDKAL